MLIRDWGGGGRGVGQWRDLGLFARMGLLIVFIGTHVYARVVSQASNIFRTGESIDSSNNAKAIREKLLKGHHELAFHFLRVCEYRCCAKNPNSLRCEMTHYCTEKALNLKEHQKRGDIRYLGIRISIL